MTNYQSITISLNNYNYNNNDDDNDSNDWKVTVDPYDDFGGKRAPHRDSLIESVIHGTSTSSDIYVGPMESYITKGDDYDAVLEGHPKLSSKSKKDDVWSLNSIMVTTTLFLGLSVGFLVGFYASESRMSFKQATFAGRNNPSMSVHEMGKNILSNHEAQKMFQFMDEYLFRDSPALFTNNNHLNHEGILQNNPIMRFPLQLSNPLAKRPLTYLNGPDAYSWLLDTTNPLLPGTISQYSNDFFLISSGLDAQINQAYCGVASAVAILNSLRFIKTGTDDNDGVDIPIDPNFNPYPYATQTDVFNNCTRQTVISRTGGGPGLDGILTPPFGLNMEQVAKLLQCHLQSTNTFDWKVSIQYVDNTHQTVGKMKFDLKNALADPNSRVLVNYDRETVGQVGGGHWSPVGSYSDKQDAFLILDVAKYKYPPVWIPSERLFDGMSTMDDCGEWNFPNGQDFLSQEERFSHNQVDYATAKAKVG